MTSLVRNTHVYPAVLVAATVSLATGWFAAVAPGRLTPFANGVLLERNASLIFGGVGGFAFLAFAVRSLMKDDPESLISRLVLSAYFGLLFFGLFALSLLRMAKTAGWPIAATQPLPTESDAR